MPRPEDAETTWNSGIEEPPFDPTGPIDDESDGPRITIEESDPDALRQMWKDKHDEVVDASVELGVTLRYLAAIEDRMRELAPKDAREGGRQIRRALDDMDAISMLVNRLSKRKEFILKMFRDLAESMELDKFATGYCNITRTEQQHAKYDPAKYPDIVVNLVGVNADLGSINLVANAVEEFDFAKILEPAERQKFAAAIRSILHMGHLDCLHRRFADAKVAELAISDEGLPEGLTVEPLTIMRVSRVRGTKLAHEFT